MDKVSLKANNGFDGLRRDIGEAKLTSSTPETVLSIAPFVGQTETASEVLLEVIGHGLTGVGEVFKSKKAWILWAGYEQWFVIGDVKFTEFSKALGKVAALTDQSDAWVVFALTGAGSKDVMARLCPLDLSDFNAGQTARTEFAHIHAVITPIKNGYEIMVPRSFSRTAVNETIDAMTRVDARNRL